MHPTQALLARAFRAMFEEPAPPEPELFFLDTFTAANGTTLADHLCDYPGLSYTDSGAALITIEDNAALATGGIGNNAVVDVGQSDYTLTANMLGPSGPTVLVRYLDASNHWRVILTTGGVLRIQKVETGSISTVVESGTHTYNFPQQMTITCSGQDIKLEALGESVHYDESDFAMFGTQLGLRGGSYSCDQLAAYTIP